MQLFFPNIIFGQDVIAVLLMANPDPQSHDVNHG